MLSNPWLLFLGTMSALAVYWSVPRERYGLRQLVLLVASVVMVFLYTPGGFLVCLFLTLVPLAAQRIYARKRGTPLFWLGVAIVLSPLVSLRLFTDQSFLISFGVAFATVKSLGLLLTAYTGRVRFSASDAGLLIFFFPLFTIGPVEKLNSLRAERFNVAFDPGQAVHGIYRIVTGLFLIMFVANDMLFTIRNTWFGRDLEAIQTFGHLEALGLVIVSFLFTYLSFEGFSSVAIGIGRLFGINVIENFDRPLMVSNLAEFWKRYHISMGDWINQYLFFPIAILLKGPWAGYAATVITFILFGLWHAFTWNYFVWGLGNGIVVAAIRYAESRKVFPLVKAPGPMRVISKIAGGSATIIYISWLQTFANLDDFGTAVGLTCKLLFASVGACG